MRRITKISAIVSLVGAASLGLAQPALAATTIHDSDTNLIPGHNATFTVTADDSGISVKGHVAKITNASCTAAAVGRGGGADSVSGYLDSSWTFYGTKINSASVQASTDGIGGSVAVSSTQVTVHGPRQTWKNSGGKSFSQKNLVVDGGNAAAWTYVRATCTATITSLPDGDVRSTAQGRS